MPTGCTRSCSRCPSRPPACRCTSPRTAAQPRITSTPQAGRAAALPVYSTENGRAAEDYVNPQGEVDDLERVRYLNTHLEAAARAIKDGASLAGYFVWSLLDNFEWAWGYQKRFGIGFVHFGNQRRIPKASARFYADVVRANAVPLPPADWTRSAAG